MKFIKQQLYIILLTILSFGFGFFLLGKESFWVDEISSITFVRNFTNMIDIIFHKETNMWLYYILLHGWIKFGESELWVRSLSVLFIGLSVPSIYLLNKEMFNEKTAKIASFLFVINAFVIFYAQEARSYSLFLLLSILSTLFWFKVRNQGTTKHWILWIISSILMVYSQLIGILYFGIQVLLYLLAPASKQYKKLLRALLFFSAFLLPIIIFPAELISGILNWIPKPSLQDLGNLLINFASNSFPLLLVYLFCIGVSVRHYLGGYKKNGNMKSTWNYISVILLATLPILLVFIESIIYKPRFIDRYFIASLPLFLSLVALGLSQFKNTYYKIAVLTVVIIFSALSLFTYYTSDKKDNWRQTAHTVQTNSQSKDAVLIYPEFLNEAFQFYAVKFDTEKNLVYYTFNYQPLNGTYSTMLSIPNQQLINIIARRHKRIWYISSHLINSDREQVSSNIIKELTKNKYSLRTQYTLPNDISVKLYEQ